MEKLDLATRVWRCPSCQGINDRDENAAINICAVGASTVCGELSRTAGLGDVRRSLTAIPA